METRGPLTLFNIRRALGHARLEEKQHYEMYLTGNGYVITFYSEVDACRFAIGLADVIGSGEAQKEFQTFQYREHAGGGGVDLVLTGSYVGV